MKTIIKGDEEKKQTYLTFVFDWNNKEHMSIMNELITFACTEREEK